jgi:hypothetical protein
VYEFHFKCNIGSIRGNFPNLNYWMKNLYHNEAAFGPDTTNFEHIKHHYFSESLSLLSSQPHVYLRSHVHQRPTLRSTLRGESSSMVPRSLDGPRTDASPRSPGLFPSALSLLFSPSDLVAGDTTVVSFLFIVR